MASQLCCWVGGRPALSFNSFLSLLTRRATVLGGQRIPLHACGINGAYMCAAWNVFPACPPAEPLFLPQDTPQMSLSCEASPGPRESQPLLPPWGPKPCPYVLQPCQWRQKILCLGGSRGLGFGGVFRREARPPALAHSEIRKRNAATGSLAFPDVRWARIGMHRVGMCFETVKCHTDLISDVTRPSFALG